MKGIRRIMSGWLVVCMLITMLPIQAFANSDEMELQASENPGGTCGDDLTWEIDTVAGTLSISGIGAMWDFSYEIDWTNGGADTTIPWWNKENINGIKKVVVSEGVTSLGDNAFRGLVEVLEIVLPDSLTEIGDCVFYGCRKLQQIELPADIIEIGEYAFQGCKSISSITVPNRITSLKYGAFSYCTSLQEISLPDGLTEIGDNVFEYCALETVEIPDTVTHMGQWVFTENEDLTEITIPASVKSLGMQLFQNCTNLRNITFMGDAPIFEDMNGEAIPEQFDNIAATVYYPANNATWTADVMQNYGGTITWAPYGGESEHIHNFGDWYETKAATTETGGEERRDCTGCDHYETRVVEKQLSSGGDHEHSYTAAVTAPTCTEQGYTTYTCSCNDSYVDDYMDAIGHAYDDGVVTTEPVCEAEGVKTFTCFHDTIHTYTESVPATGHSFGDWYEAKESTEEAEGEERRDCVECDHFETRAKEKLPVIEGSCGENLTWIFDEASGILTISGSGTMDNFTASTFPWKSYHSQIHHVVINEGVTSIGKCAFYSCKNITTIAFASSVTYIGESAFRDCESLKDIVIPQSVTNIDKYAFYDCESLTEIVLPNSVTEIGNSVFCGCKNIATVTIGDGINAISSSLFSGCRSLKTVTISASVNSIGNSAFQSCIALEAVYFGGTERTWNKMVLRDTLKEDNEVLASVTVYFGAEDKVSFDGGNGTADNPYLVSTAAQLDAVRDDLKAHYVQTTDIDLEGMEWVPIGEYTDDEETWFAGSYDGQKYVIRNMSISKMPENHVTVGLFGINDGTLENIVLEKSNIQINTVVNDDLYGNACFGGIAGNNRRTVTGCSNSGCIDVNVVSDWSVDVGGIVGSGVSDIKSVLESCTNYAQITVSGTGDESTIDLRCGGIVGYPGAINRDVVSCINYGNVIGTLNAYDTQSSICCGGITGHHGELICCVNYGDISGKINSVDIFYGPHTCSVGGLSGYNAAGDANYDGSVDCVNFGSVEAHSTNDGVHVHAGGLFGYLTGEATKCYNLASSVHADSFEGEDNKFFSYVGCISGRSGELNNCYSIATTVVGAGEAKSISMQGISMTESQIYFAIADILTSLGLPVPEVEKEFNGASIRYFRKWDADTQTAYWGEEPPIVEGLDLGSQVTAETDTSFIANVDDLVGTYVLAKTKTRDDGMIAADILLSIKPLETKTGTITAIGFTTITIDGVEYSIPENVNVYDLNVGDSVMYHLYNGDLVGINGKGSADDDNDDSAENISTVRYYSFWDVNNKVAQFGPNDYKGLLMTDETDISFKTDPTKYLNQYVLVESKAGSESGDRDILIGMKPVQTKTGTVTSADNSAIVIDGTNYTAHEELGSLSSYENQFVVYHLYNGTLVGIETLEKKEGILTYWNKEANAINIKQNADDKDVILYHLSSVSDAGTTVFLDTVANQDTSIAYFTDCNNLLYNARKLGYRLEVTTKDDISTTIQVGKTVTIYASLFCNDETVDDWEKPQVLLMQDGSTKIISYGAWQAWPNKYNLEISGVKSGKVEMTILDTASNATATIAIEVTPEDPLDGLSHEEWIQKHIDYTNSSAYKEQVVPGFNGILLETYENAKNNKWTSVYSTLDGINKVLGFDGEKLNETQEYELLLAQILFRRTGVTAIEDMYDSFLSDAYVKVLDVLFTSTDNAAGTGNIAGLDEDTIKLLDKLCDFVAGSEEFNTTLDAILENLKKVEKPKSKLNDIVSKEISFATSVVMDQIDDTIDNMGEFVTYLAAGEAYCKTSDAFGKMLLAMRSNINNPALTIPDFGNYNINSPFVGAQLDAAIENFYTSMKSYEENEGKEIANKALEKYKKDMINSAVDAGLDVAVSLLECIPVVKAFSVVRDMFDGTQFLIKTFTSIDEQEYHGTMLIRLYCMERLHYITANGYAMNSANWGMVYNPLYEFDPDAQFEHSLLFDESIAVYRAIASVAADYAEQYLAAYYNPVTAGKYGHLTDNSSISGFGVLRTQLDYEWCHSPYATFEEYCEANGIVILDGGNVIEYKFKCPVEITVKNEQGSIIAVLRNGDSDIADGYEHYFFTTELEKGSGEYLKVASVPDTYSVSIKGTGTGSMDAYVSTYSNSQVSETRCFLDVPITESTEGHFVDGNEISGAKVLHIEDDTLIGKPIEAVIHVPGLEIYSDSTNHWHKCTGCDEKLDMAAHSGGTPTCTKKAICSVCGTSYGELASHDYKTSWSQGDANGHWHECKNCSAHDTQVKHTPGAAATETTAQFCTVCDYVITPALGHTCTAGSKWYSNGTYHWHVCTSCGAWVKTSYHSYSSDTDKICNVCGYTRTVTATEPTEETEVAMTETTEATVPGEEVIATETDPTIVSTETNENLSDNAVSEDTDSHGISGMLITVFVIVALGSLAALTVLLIYKKRRKSE